MESKNTNSDTDINTNTEQTINFNLDLGFDIKYSTWLKLKESEQKNEIDPRWENLKKLLTDK